MKRKRSWTEPALLAAVWTVLALLDTVARYPVEELRAMAARVLPPGGLEPPS